MLTQAFYEFPKAGKAWESAAEQTQWSIRTYSDHWLRYPYPQATSVAGPVGGMEYPMFVMVHYGTDDPTSIFNTIDHEQGHEWFPMIVGSNERRYAWQDEGFNTYQNAFSNERRVPGSNLFPAYMANWRQSVDDGTQSPLMTPPDRIDASALGAIGYRKPGATLLTLRDAVIGRETMDRAMREYARRWAFKHPTPADFFRTVENVSGEDLSWFWSAFFYGTDVLDIAVDGVSMRDRVAARASPRFTCGVSRVSRSRSRCGSSSTTPSTQDVKTAGRDLVGVGPLHLATCRSVVSRLSAFGCGPTRTSRTGTRRTTPGATRRRPTNRAHRRRPRAASLPPLPASPAIKP